MGYIPIKEAEEKYGISWQNIRFRAMTTGKHKQGFQTKTVKRRYKVMLVDEDMVKEMANENSGES